MKKENKRRKYSPEFKQDAIKLAENIGVGQTADKLNIPLGCLHGRGKKTFPLKNPRML